MIIYSKPSATTPYQVNLPQIGRDYWLPVQKIMEAATIPTSTESAGVFRAVVKYDVTSIKKTYSVLMSPATAAILAAMAASSDQLSYLVNTGAGIFDVTMEIAPVVVSPTVTRVVLTFSVNSQVS